jgi:dihydrofolate synthase / folylpolyglutamate synthase
MDPLEFLFSLERLGMKFGLANMAALCARLGHPERTFPSVIVAGTNGKGSVTAMTAAALTAAGHRCGRYTSPHLERLEERFTIAGDDVGTSDLRDAADTVGSAARALVADGVLDGLPTFFECATAVAFELFCRADVDLAVLEVGLGGRLDATNIVSPIAAAIVSIDFDHQALLGDTLAAIAREKAGVIKPGIPVVCGPVPAEAAAVIAAVCSAQHARLVDVAREVRWSTTITDAGTRLDVTTATRRLADVPLGLAGAHQGINAAVAVALLDVLDEFGFHLDDTAVLAGLRDVRWPARLERRTWHGADMILDAAHNPGGARALAAHLYSIGWQGCTLLIGALADKDAQGIVEALVPVAGRVVCTTPDSPRAVAGARLAGLVRRVAADDVEVTAVEPLSAAAAEACRAGGRVVAAGSIFLVGPLRGILR